jgi:hypothetical protein
MNVTLAKHAELRPLILATVCSMLFPRAISAQPVTPRPKVPDTSPKEVEAHRHFKQGDDFLKANAYTEAIAEFEIAHKLIDSKATQSLRSRCIRASSRLFPMARPQMRLALTSLY